MPNILYTRRSSGFCLVRDTKARSGPVLWFSPGAWRTFAGRLKVDPSPRGLMARVGMSGTLDVDVTADGRGDGG